MPRRRIYLVGLSGSGKSTSGRLLAEKLGWEFVDTDREIEDRVGKPVARIFGEEGESSFRALERSALLATKDREPVVVATGGGAPLSPVWQEVTKDALVIWLDVPPEEAAERLRSSGAEERPLLAGDPAGRLRALLALRRPRYARAHLVVSTAGATAAEVAERLNAAARRYFADDVLRPACEVRAASARYPVFVAAGGLKRLGDVAREVGLRGRGFLISDEVVAPRLASVAEQALRSAGYETATFAFPAGEEQKTLQTVTAVYRWLVSQRAERGDFIVCLGGGVVTDLGGFVAATYLRGVPFLHVPTTLLGMVDAAIGGKTGVDLPEGKNLVGAFAQPRAVLIDPDVLASLPERELRAGAAELVKHGLILDETLFADLERAGTLARMIDPALIARSVAVKAAVVSADERESGLRALLNYGHTLGHALEAATAYRRFLHGEAIAVGMYAAGRIAVEMGMLAPEAFERQQRLLTGLGLPDRAPGIPPEPVMAAMMLDKKVRGGQLRWILLERIGRATVRDDVPEPLVREVVHEVVSA